MEKSGQSEAEKSVKKDPYKQGQGWDELYEWFIDKLVNHRDTHKYEGHLKRMDLSQFIWHLNRLDFETPTVDYSQLWLMERATDAMVWHQIGTVDRESGERHGYEF